VISFQFSIFDAGKRSATGTRELRAAKSLSFIPAAALCERRHRGLARRRVAVRRRSIFMLAKGSVHIHGAPTRAACSMSGPIFAPSLIPTPPSRYFSDCEIFGQRKKIERFIHRPQRCIDDLWQSLWKALDWDGQTPLILRLSSAVDIEERSVRVNLRHKSPARKSYPQKVELNFGSLHPKLFSQIPGMG
jgi:hypothetical protein